MMHTAVSPFGRLQRTAARILGDESGATAIEYAVIASGVAIVIAAVVLAAGSNLRDNAFQEIINRYPS
jgi:pilus assembly protein Flp/PilA